MAKFDQGESYSGNLGFADLEQKKPLTTDTIFNLASVSKQFTAFAILLLEQNGQLALHDPITKYIPELPEYANEITIQDLIYHISGMVDYIELALNKGVDYADSLGPEESLADLIAYPSPLSPVGKQFDYCNTGYFLLLNVLVAKVITNLPGNIFLSHYKWITLLSWNRTLFTLQLLEGTVKTVNLVIN
nr:serine hydrolase domain-containing protein [Providencia rettgeri]